MQVSAGVMWAGQDSCLCRGKHSISEMFVWLVAAVLVCLDEDVVACYYVLGQSSVLS